MRYDYKYRINNKDKGDLAMELKELTSAEQVVMKCIWDYGKDMPLQQLIKNLKQDYGKDYKRTAKFVKGMRKKGESIETDTSSLLILIFRFTVMVSEWRVYWR